jgi:hypothetical protein
VRIRGSAFARGKKNSSGDAQKLLIVSPFRLTGSDGETFIYNAD